MSNLIPINDIERMAQYITKSNFFGMKTPEQTMALMLIAQAEGKHPATAAQEYHVIQGKPALKADAMLARFQAAGGKVQWKELNDKVVTGIFTHAAGGTAEITWTMEMAQAAKLTGKDTWKQYPRQMLRARVVSEGIRTVYPGVAVGVYTPEEVQDFTEEKPMVDITPTNGDLTSKKAYGSATAMKKKWAEVRDKINTCNTDEQLDAVFAEHKVDFINFRAIDEQLFDSLADVGQARRNAIRRVVDAEVEEIEVPAFIKDMDEQFRNTVG